MTETWGKVGNIKGPSGPNAFVFKGIQQLVSGQKYIDVVFASPQPDTNWSFGECLVMNSVDATPQDIWHATVTAKTTTGFRLQLNVAPNNANYYLHWAISSVIPLSATGYSMSGPTAGWVTVASTEFTVTLTPEGVGVPADVTVTPSDGSGGGTFTPMSVKLNTNAPSATFKYTATSVGAKTIHVTNNRGLADPSDITYLAASAFRPTSVQTCGAWFDPAALSSLNDGDDVTLWEDSSGLEPLGTPIELTSPWTSQIPESTSPVLRKNVINGIAAVRFDGISAMMLSSYYNISYPDTMFIVAKQTSKATEGVLMQGWGDDPQVMRCMKDSGYYEIGDLTIVGQLYNDTTDHSGAFHVFRFHSYGADAKGYVDGVLKCAGPCGNMGSYSHLFGTDGTGNFLTGDICEMIYYAEAGSTGPDDPGGLLSVSDIKLIENYLANRYALPHAVPIVPGPSNVASLKFWLKADAITQSDNTEITTWPDSSGNGHPFLKGSATGPTFKTNIVNGKPVVRFNGTQYLNNTQGIGGHQPYTVIVVANVTTDGYLWYNPPYPTGEVRVYSTALSMSSDPGTRLSDNINHQGAFHVFVAEFNSGPSKPTNSKAYVDGVQTMTGDAGQSGLGTQPRIGMSSTCDIAEVIVYPRILTHDERVEIELYLKMKYATP
jgi:hypothetical protein